MTPDHVHEGFDPGDVPDPYGRPVNLDLMRLYLAAAYDGCQECQEVYTAQLAEDPVTTARIAELACIAVASLFGGIPPGMYDDEAPGQTSPEFRRLARAGADGDNAALFAECERMSGGERRAALETAADTLIGFLTSEIVRVTLDPRR